MGDRDPSARDARQAAPAPDSLTALTRAADRIARRWRATGMVGDGTRDERVAAVALRREFVLGALVAATHASSYDASTTHRYRLGDCVLAKMNLRQAAPRRNQRRLDDPRDCWILGFAAALSEVVQFAGADPASIRRIAREAGLTLGELRRAGVLPGIISPLRRAGVPSGPSTEGVASSQPTPTRRADQRRARRGVR